MKKLIAMFAGLLAIFCLASTPAMAVDFGWSPLTGTEAFHGVFVSQGGNVPALAPVLTYSGGCGTVVNPKGGATAGQATIGTFSVSCTITVTFPTAAPNGWSCRFNDLTTPANAIPQATSTTTTCVSTAATLVTGDTFQWFALGY